VAAAPASIAAVVPVVTEAGGLAAPLAAAVVEASAAAWAEVPAEAGPDGFAVAQDGVGPVLPEVEQGGPVVGGVAARAVAVVAQVCCPGAPDELEVALACSLVASAWFAADLVCCQAAQAASVVVPGGCLVERVGFAAVRGGLQVDRVVLQAGQGAQAVSAGGCSVALVVSLVVRVG
jgi:hypothetical protein